MAGFGLIHMEFNKINCIQWYRELFQMSRMLAGKAALAIRVDALGDETNCEMGLEHRAKLESRIRLLENRGVSSVWMGVCLCA